MASTDFKTQSKFVPGKNPGVKGYWPVALDIGYSGVKGFSPNSVFCFPSFVRQEEGEMIGKHDPMDMQYRDETGVYDVGESAIETLSLSETQSGGLSILGRNRYTNRMFLILARVGMALGMTQNEFGDPGIRTVFLQTGLPPAYMVSDEPLLKSALAGRHLFSLRMGDGDWKTYDVLLPPENIQVMPQPMGAMFGAATDDSCVQLPEGGDYLRSGLLVFDGGFGTLDTFDVVSGRIVDSQTFPQYGMAAVFKRLSKEIMKRYHTEISLTGLQKVLASGTITSFDRGTMTTRDYTITPLLEECSREICQEALREIKSLYNDLRERRYLLITGGTGAAWYPYLSEHFAGLSTLRVIRDEWVKELGSIFSNVRGYYLFLVTALRSR